MTKLVKENKGKLKKLTGNLLLLAIFLGLSLLGLELVVSRFLPYLGVLSEGQLETLYSMNIIDADTHPKYQKWLQGFMSLPFSPAESSLACDTYRVYEQPEKLCPRNEFAPADKHGFRSHRPVEEAEVIFIGDSFTYGLGAGTESSIPYLFEQRTGRKTFNAGIPTIGLGHYAKVMEKLVCPAQGGAPFKGREVYIVLYPGNDILADIENLHFKALQDREGFWRHLQLDSLGKLCFFYSHGMLAPLWEERKVQNDGMFPVPLISPSVNDLPMAFHPYFFQYSFSLKKLDSLQYSGAVQALKEIRRMEKSCGLTIHWLILPDKLQVLARHIDQSKIDKDTFFAQNLPEALKQLDRLTETARKLLHQHGYQPLDLSEQIIEREDASLLFWATDTHMTPQGYKAVVDSLHSRIKEQ